MALARVARVAVAVASRRVGLVAARAFSAKAEDAGNVDITKYFLELDAKAAKEAAPSLPIKLSGRSGELVAELYAASQKSKSFDKVVKELQGFVAAVQSSGLVVDRFFQTANYSPEECAKVVELLTTTKEPLTSFASIKDAEVKEVLVDNEGNLDAWRNARKAVQAAGLSEAVTGLLSTLAREAHLNRVKLIAAKAAELRAVTSKTVDATVTSAVPLSKAQQEAVSKALPTYAPSGQTLAVNFVVDPAVLGGLLVTMANQTIDLSATSRLVEVSAARF